MDVRELLWMGCVWGGFSNYFWLDTWVFGVAFGFSVFFGVNVLDYVVGGLQGCC